MSMANLEKAIFDKLKELTYKNDTRADLTIDEYAKIFDDQDVFIKETTNFIMNLIKKEV